MIEIEKKIKRFDKNNKFIRSSNYNTLTVCSKNKKSILLAGIKEKKN